jgi:hypothetical protein
MRARSSRIQAEQRAVRLSIHALQRYKRVVTRFARCNGEGWPAIP